MKNARKPLSHVAVWNRACVGKAPPLNFVGGVSWYECGIKSKMYRLNVGVICHLS